MDRKILRKLEGDLDDRIAALYDDLQLISTSEHLRVWRSRHNDRLLDATSIMEKIIMSFSPMYVYAVKRYKKKIGRYNMYVYWMDVMDETSIKDERIFEPSFALRNITSRIGKETSQILTNAVKSGIMPYHEDKALSELDFANALRDENKISILKNSAIIPSTPATIKLKPEFYDKYQEMWRNVLDPILGDLNKVIMKKYNYSLALSSIRAYPLHIEIGS